jgi:predicted phosphate transport protein (TIGR00153 family)
MFEALTDGDEEKLAAISKDISKIEHRADEIKNEIRDSLPRSIFLPVDRVDLLRVLSRQDSIPDTVENIANLLTLRRTYVPPAWRDPLLSFIDKCVATFRATHEIYNILKDLFDVGPTEREAEDILAKIDAIGQLEWEADKAQFEMLRIMFDMEDDLKPMDIFWWAKIFREVSDLANYSEKSADRIRLML